LNWLRCSGRLFQYLCNIWRDRFYRSGRVSRLYCTSFNYEIYYNQKTNLDAADHVSVTAPAFMPKINAQLGTRARYDNDEPVISATLCGELGLQMTQVLLRLPCLRHL
jgi:hypothetical protein